MIRIVKRVAKIKLLQHRRSDKTCEKGEGERCKEIKKATSNRWPPLMTNPDKLKNTDLRPLGKTEIPMLIMRTKFTLKSN
ncbi:hypothetical protein SOASR029_17610 [Budvicia aquatica]|nr:hypothetical protein SOASR029_17610 [Budvicia aquatica]